MRSNSLIIGVLTICLAYAQGQFWKQSTNDYQSWERETIANREPGICYKTVYVQTLNPELRQRQISHCCKGYAIRKTSNSGTLLCEPICNPECINGVCVSPGNCECGPGYSYHSESERPCRKYGE
ncbi:PREDICTED: epidermal growth factor-like protein 6 isoform X1 [Drosophila arizonae]|uniref:Epidermal growth factor-like protein 6 isoform X1 n=1 Tax=Drosophila arizonae TaxID=7263 RepID=A0ABM1NVH0_DROAR|nr:PREDICTED: epidermal growth factor-like protein 6 isoform X1 [Drosophila arizonae]